MYNSVRFVRQVKVDDVWVDSPPKLPLLASLADLSLVCGALGALLAELGGNTVVSYVLPSEWKWSWNVYMFIGVDDE